MAAPIQFESSWEKEKYREVCRKEREKILSEAKEEYEKKERRKERARQQGEGSWMLPSVDSRIQSEEQELEKALSSKHKKKHKKEKKSKKSKKKHRKHSSGSSESSSEEEAVWQDKNVDVSTDVSNNARSIGPKLERDSWMTSSSADHDIFAGLDLAERRRNAKAELRKAEADAMEEMRSKRELNPYWKDGGTGLPPELSDHNPPAPKTMSSANDGGLSWWRKAYQRCTELAEAEGRSLEEIAAERYGLRVERYTEDAVQSDFEKELLLKSLEELKSKLQHAEAAEKAARKEGKGKSSDNVGDSGLKSMRFHRPGYNDREEMPHSRGSDKQTSFKFRRPDDDEDDSFSGRREQSKGRPSERHCPSAPSAWRKKDVPPSKPSLASQFKKARDRSSSDSEHDAVDSRDDRRRHGSADVLPSSAAEPRAKREETSRHRRRSPTSSSSSSSSDDGSDAELPPKKSDSTAKRISTSKAEEDKPVVKPLNEQEINQLGAKILKAELMGNETLARELKNQLEAARRLNAEKKPEAKATSKAGEETEVVVLSRTDSRGSVRPVFDRKHPVEPQGGRRKKQKVATHNKQGERERYFDDDDNFSLKTLVEREKLGTAEDQNRMFARLAGRGIDRTDDDYQMDDAFLSKAVKKQSQSHIESRDRQLAIIEHKKMSASLDKCQFCFSNIPKHLIVAIGLKVCLMVPNHRSMNDGHCLIVPMQHVVQSTVVDEDVWDEIKIFRKGLSRMFDDNDQDCVFMETAMNLKRFPHMFLECIPLPKDVGDTAPIYFKKAIMECEAEWADNKKLVDLSKKDIRKSVPKGFSYFSVDFGMQGGYAHVIEDERSFPAYFGREVVGGMLDLEPSLWRKPHQERFDDQRKKVLKFAEMWKPYDWTQRLKKPSDDDADTPMQVDEEKSENKDGSSMLDAATNSP